MDENCTYRITTEGFNYDGGFDPYCLAVRGLCCHIVEVEIVEEYVLPIHGGGALVLKRRFIVIKININNIIIKKKYELKEKTANVIAKVSKIVSPLQKINAKLLSVKQTKIYKIEAKQEDTNDRIKA